MKKVFVYIFLLFYLISFSQEKITVSNGYITFNSGSTLYFKNLSLEGNTVKFINEISNMEMSFSKDAVKQITDNAGSVIYAKKNQSSAKDEPEKKLEVAEKRKGDKEKLIYVSSNKIMLNGHQLSKDDLENLLRPEGRYELYKKGKNNATLGTVLIGGGIGLFIGGGISNLINANNSSTDFDNSNNKKVGPELLITGIAISIIGIPIKIGGNRKIKNALNQYNYLLAKDGITLRRTEVKVIAGSAGIGFQLQF